MEEPKQAEVGQKRDKEEMGPPADDAVEHDAALKRRQALLDHPVIAYVLSNPKKRRIFEELKAA